MPEVNLNISENIRNILALPDIGQIGIVVRDIESAQKIYSNLFGVTEWEDIAIPSFVERSYRGYQGDFSYKVALTKNVKPQWELIQPMVGKTVFDDDLGENGEGLHHLGFLVDNIDDRIEAAKELGITVTQSARRPEVKSKWAYLDTKSICGVTIEFIQKPYEEL